MFSNEGVKHQLSNTQPEEPKRNRRLFVGVTWRPPGYTSLPTPWEHSNHRPKRFQSFVSAGRAIDLPVLGLPVQAPCCIAVWRQRTGVEYTHLQPVVQLLTVFFHTPHRQTALECTFLYSTPMDLSNMVAILAPFRIQFLHPTSVKNQNGR